MDRKDQPAKSLMTINAERNRIVGRAFAYTSASLVIGVIIFMLTDAFLVYTERPDWIGSVVLGLYGLVFFNVTFVLSRRFTGKTDLFPLFPYLIALLIIIPMILLSELTERFMLQQSVMILAAVLLPASLLGARFGIQRGDARRKKRQISVHQKPENNTNNNPK